MVNAIGKWGRAGVVTLVGFPYAAYWALVERWVSARSLGCAVKCVFAELTSTADEKSLRLEFLFYVFR